MPPFAGIEARIVEPESGSVVATDVQGEIQIRGPNLMRGICGRTRAEIFDVEGYYSTGDLGMQRRFVGVKNECKDVAMITLYDNAFSPFARKVRMVLEHKGLAFEAFDGLSPAGHARLVAVNPRVEVPVLVDDRLVVVNSPQIVAYLEHRYPDRPVYPTDPAACAGALAWERRADTLLDAITHDASNGGFGFPDDTRPAGLLRAARDDLAPIYDDLERALAGGDYLCGALSIAELALFPHLTALRFLDLSFDGATHPRLLAWYKRLRRHDVCGADLARIQTLLANAGTTLQRPARIVWRGDRIEWMLARGFHDWFFAELRAGRIAWPG